MTHRIDPNAGYSVRLTHRKGYVCENVSWAEARWHAHQLYMSWHCAECITVDDAAGNAMRWWHYDDNGIENR